MIGRFAVLAGRIRQDLAEIERIVQLTTGLRLACAQANAELEAFATFLEGLAQEA